MNLDQNRVPAVYIRKLLELLNDWGVSTDDILEGTGIDPELLEGSGHFLTLRHEMAILERVEVLSPVPEWSLRRGQGYSVQTHGVYGYAVLTCADLRGVVQLVVRFFKLAGTFADSELHEHANGDYELRLVENVRRPSLHRFAIEEAMASIVKAYNEILGKEFIPKNISFDYPAPEYKSVYQDVFSCPVNFGSQYNSLIIKQQDLGLRIPTWDPLTMQACESQCEQILERMREAEGIIDDVRRILLRLPCDRRNAERVAEEINMSTRNLRRKLEQEGSSFQKVLDDVRCGLAKEYLAQTELRLEDIAPLLGFSETSNLRRAFKKWTDQTPTEYRESLAG